MVSGITGVSPAISYASAARRLVYSVYESDKYNIYASESGPMLAGQPAVTLDGVNAAKLPPTKRVSEQIVNLQENPTIGLPAARKAAQIAPNDPQVLDTLGWTFAQAGLLYNAEQTLNRAIKLEPSMTTVLASAHLHLAETFLRKGDQASALRELRIVQELDPAGPFGTTAAQIIQQYFP